MSRKHIFMLGAFISLVLAAGLWLPPMQSSKVRRHNTRIHTERNAPPSMNVTVATNEMIGRPPQGP